MCVCVCVCVCVCELRASCVRQHQECSPAEELQSSQGELSFCASRASRKGSSSVWVLATWNVHTLLDVDSVIKIARIK